MSQKTISNWISHIRIRQKGTRDGKIIKLDKLGWNHELIGELVDLSRQQIDNIANNFNFENICMFYEKGREVSEIAEINGLDLITTWAIILDGLDDLERFNLSFKESNKECKYELYDIWNFPERDTRLGLRY